MPILFNQRVCFIHIPKTGGTTIEQVLYGRFPEDFALFWAGEAFQKKLPNPIHPSPLLHEKFERLARQLGLSSEVSPQHYTYRDLKQLLPDLDRWFCFAVVRNPWERIFSEWKYSKLVTLSERRAFSDFVGWVESESHRDRCARNNHFRPQVDFLDSNVRLIRFENFEREVVDLLGELGIEVGSLPHIYRTTEKGEYRKYYDRQLVRRVADLYQADIEAFGYVS